LRAVPRPADFDLARELAKPSFTPGRADAPGLAALVAGGTEPAATRATAALGGLGAPARAAIEVSVGAATDDGAKARLVAALGLVARAGDDAAQRVLIDLVAATSVRVRRAAITALGKLGTDDARAAILARWDAGDAPPDERRALTDALGKLGAGAALPRLQALDAAADPELARRRDRALLVADREAKRGATSEVLGDVIAVPPSGATVRLGCRGGFAALLREELGALGHAARDVTPSTVELPFAAIRGRLDTLFASRLWVTAAIRVPLPAGSLAPSIVATLASAPVRALLAAWTRGPIRWRLTFAHGHQRGVVWAVARDVTAAAPELLNDPTSTTWDVLVANDARALDLVPRKLADPRFAYRVAEVPAASHPTVAAALAFVGAPRDGERVWDPFCGAGAELIECARRARGSFVGTDIDPTALAAARANAASLELHEADARTARVPCDLIITNPPLGSRVQVDAAALLEAALPNLVRSLSPRGRLVWITPAPRRTGPVLAALGLTRTRVVAVDLGGVRGTLERWDMVRR
jgi:hypothetical protein